MYCKVCREHDKVNTTSPFITGSQNFRRSAIIDHIGKQNSPHQLAVSASTAPSITEKLLTPAKLHQAVIAALETAFFTAKKEHPNEHYGSTINFLRHRNDPDAIHLNCGDNASYDSATTFKSLLDSIDNVLTTELVTKLTQSPFIGAGLDESTDISLEKHVLFCVRYFDTVASKFVTEYWKVDEIEDGTAETLFNAFTDLLESYGLTITKVCKINSNECI